MQRYRRIILSIMIFLLASLAGCSSCNDPHGSPVPDSSLAPASDTPSDKPTAASEFAYAYGTCVSGVDISGMTKAEAIEALQKAETELINAYKCTLLLDDRSFTLTASDITVMSDLDRILKAAEGVSGLYQIAALPVDDERLDSALEKIAETINIESEPERIKVNDMGDRSPSFSIIKGKSGLEMDEAKAKEQILEGLTSIEICMTEVEACVGMVKLPKLRGRCATEFNQWNENRSFNLAKAASLINGYILSPDKTLSFGDVLGPRTEENGWKMAEAYINGGLESEDQYGGGICQVSTTLYNAALKADLSVPTRFNHSKPVPYVPAGLDAAISEGALDLVIRNNTPSDIYIFMWAENGQLVCEIYGSELSDDYDRIELISEFKDSILPGEAEFYDDFELPYGETLLITPAVTGSVYESYKVFYLGDKEIKRERITESRYRSHPAVYAVGRNHV